jgi:methyltransferase (TIGR00027 family)
MLDLLPSTTAELVCYLRAAEYRRPEGDRILADPYAHLFLNPVFKVALVTPGTAALANFATPALAAYVPARHRFIDDVLVKACEQEVDQVVLLGAGYDTRVFRLADVLKDIPFYEVDFPSTSRRKQRRVQALGDQLPSREVRRVTIDFQTQDLGEVLVEAGLNTDCRTLWIWEGVSMYLTREAIKSTLSTLHRLSGPGSQLAMDFWFLVDAPDARSTVMRMSGNFLALLGEPITFGIHYEDVGDFVRRQGWAVREMLLPADAEERYHPGRAAYPATYVTHIGRIDL